MVKAEAKKIAFFQPEKQNFSNYIFDVFNRLLLIQKNEATRPLGHHAHGKRMLLWRSL